VRIGSVPTLTRLISSNLERYDSSGACSFSCSAGRFVGCHTCWSWTHRVLEAADFTTFPTQQQDLVGASIWAAGRGITTQPRPTDLVASAEPRLTHLLCTPLSTGASDSPHVDSSAPLSPPPRGALAECCTVKLLAGMTAPYSIWTWSGTQCRGSNSGLVSSGCRIQRLKAAVMHCGPAVFLQRVADVLGAAAQQPRNPVARLRSRALQRALVVHHGYAYGVGFQHRLR
jgi:hypothetical protein